MALLLPIQIECHNKTCRKTAREQLLTRAGELRGYYCHGCAKAALKRLSAVEAGKPVLFDERTRIRGLDVIGILVMEKESERPAATHAHS